VSVEATFDLYSDEFKDDPYPTYGAMRQHGAAYRAEYPGGLEIWLVTRYEDVQTILNDPRFSMSSDNSASPLFRDEEPDEAQRGLDRNLLNLDPPVHGPLRKLVTREFTASRVAALRPRVQRHVDELVDGFAAAGSADLIRQFAMPLPAGVAGELLGVPPGDWDEFRVMSNTLVTPEYDMGPDDFDVLKRKIRAYVARLIQQKLDEPADDLVSWLAKGCYEDGEISPDDLVGIVFTLLVGSHETTTNFVGNAVLALINHPEQIALLRNEPELIGNAVEELIRYDGPFEASSLRFALQDVELGGVVIPKGATVVGVIAAANRDPRRFPDPDDLDLSRADVAHLGFGVGTHFCPGRRLALLEAEIALGTLVRRLSDLRLADDRPLRWRAGLFFRGLHELPVTFTALS
jgi:Cytochrome P450